MKHQPTINIHNQDCMEAMAEMEDNAFDLAIVDPPYGIERFKKVTKNPSKRDVHAARFQRMETVNNNEQNENYFNELFRTSKNQIIWGANNFELPPSEYFAIWDKEQFMENFATAEYAWVSPRLKKPAKVFRYSIHKHNKTNKIHPTQKPVALYKWLLKNYASEGDKILDTHLGSGSIAIACHDMGFDLEAYEIDQEYHQAALQRLNTHRSQLQMF